MDPKRPVTRGYTKSLENMGRNTVSERDSDRAFSESELNDTVRNIDENLLKDSDDNIKVVGLLSDLEQSLSMRMNETITELLSHANFNLKGNHQQVEDSKNFRSSDEKHSRIYDRELRVDDFIRRVEHIAFSQGASLQEVANNLYLLLKGQAANWYFQWVQRNNNITWNSLKSALGVQFRSCESDYDLKHKMMNRLQKSSETFDQFYNVILDLNSRMSCPRSDRDLMEIMKRNISSKMLIFIHNSTSQTLPEFLVECRRAERHVSKIEVGFNRTIFRPKVNEIDLVEEVSSEVSDKDEFIEALSRGKSNKDVSDITCFDCREKGHFAFDWKLEEEQEIRGFCSVDHTPESELSKFSQDVQDNFHNRWEDYLKVRTKIFKEVNNEDSGQISGKILKTRQRHKQLRSEHKLVESAIISGENGDIRPFAEVKIFGHKLRGLLDSGATISVLGCDSIEFLKDHNVQISDFRSEVKTASGSTMPIVGKIITDVTFNDRSEPITFYICPGLSQKLYLGFNFWKIFGLDSSLNLEVNEIENKIDSNRHRLTDLNGKFIGVFHGKDLKQ
ncbi:hypothetical protein CVS40_11281 [Lucilia cuprina]|nr:hypothetical protein CVS40_11281 [Lucilia cuprina]